MSGIVKLDVVGVGFRKVVLASGEVVYVCVKCSSVFCSLLDVESHLAVCGVKRKKESFKYGYIGWCVKSDKVRVRVKNTVSNVLLCGGCPHFHSFERARVDAVVLDSPPVSCQRAR